MPPAAGNRSFGPRTIGLRSREESRKTMEDGEGSMDRIGESRCSTLVCSRASSENGSCVKTDRKRYRCGKRYIAFVQAHAQRLH